MIDACKHTHDSFRRVRISLTTTAGIAIFLALAGIGLTIPAEAQTGNPVLAAAHMVGDTPASSVRTLSLTLPLRNQDELATLLRHLYTPGDPLYGKYLTPQQFTQEFGPTQQQVDDVEQTARRHGLSTTDVSPNRTIIKASGSVANINATFGVTLHDYVSSDGRAFVSGGPSQTIPADLDGKILGVVGLDGSHFGRHADASGYSGPYGLIPTDIWSVYGWDEALDGAGQTVAVFEQEGWTPADISAYQTTYLFGNAVTPELESVDGGTETEDYGSNIESTMDIDLVLAMAPELAHLYVYVAPSEEFETAEMDAYNQMANDGNRPNVISSSWIEPEDIKNPTFVTSLSNIFQQLASQGQTVCIAAGDTGAYADDTEEPNTPLVNLEPAMPYVLGVGGTELTDSDDLGYMSETSWDTYPECPSTGPSCENGPGAGGGGISNNWPIPPWQVGAFTAAGNPQGSLTQRNVPDVSLYAEYDVYDFMLTIGSTQTQISAGGTSAAAPLWAGFLASVNEGRIANGLPEVGFVNPMIYKIAESANYNSDFHDIKDGSNNRLYNAVKGYDNSTGWGSFQADNLAYDLSTFSGLTVSTVSATPSPVYGKTTTLAVGVSDPYSSSFTYSWTKVSGPYASTISSPASASTLVTFSGSGYYIFRVAITDSFGMIAETEDAVTVEPTPTTIAVSPASATVKTGGTQQFSDSVTDQFGNADSALVTWSVTGVGSISASGLYTAGTTTGTATVKATCGSLTKTATVTVTGSAPPAPPGFAATGGNAQVTLSWTASTGAASYSVYRGTASNGESGTPIATGITATVYTNTGLTNGVKYYYKAAAVNTSGTSPQSGEAGATPQATSFSGTWQVTPQSATALRLNVSGNGTANGTLLTVSTSNGTTAQSFVFNNSGVVPAGDYNFTKQGGPYCVQDAGTTSGSKVEIWACGGTAAQAWAISNASTSGYYLLKPSNASTMCLNATGTASGSSVTIATCNSSTAQAWGGL